MDAFNDPPNNPDPPTITFSSSVQIGLKQTGVKQQCCGIKVDLPPGKNPHTSYPFGIHKELGDPWDYAVTNGVLVLRSKACVTNLQLNPEHCWNCKMLTKNENLQGVLQQMETGVHENTHLAYHSVGGLVTLVRRKQSEVKALHLRKLNDARKLAGKAIVIDNLKQWVMAVGSGRVEHVD